MITTFPIIVKFRKDRLIAHVETHQGRYIVNYQDQTVSGQAECPISFKTVESGIGLTWDRPGYEPADSLVRAAALALTEYLIAENKL